MGVISCQTSSIQKSKWVTLKPERRSSFKDAPNAILLRLVASTRSGLTLADFLVAKPDKLTDTHTPKQTRAKVLKTLIRQSFYDSCKKCYKVCTRKIVFR